MEPFALQVTGTMVLWALSGALALLSAALLTGGALSRHRWLGNVCGLLMLVTRGVPTSLLVVGFGIAALRYPAPTWLPDVFPGTSPGMTLVAWTVTAALALGSTGHMAVILREGCLGLGSARLDQTRTLAMRPWSRLNLLLHESATATLAPMGARLVHHLHNTAFAALFPIADAFGWVQQQASDTFEVGHYAAVGVVTYVLLSLSIWVAVRYVEYRLARRRGMHRRLPGFRLTAGDRRAAA